MTFFSETEGTPPESRAQGPTQKLVGDQPCGLLLSSQIPSPFINLNLKMRF